MEALCTVPSLVSVISRPYLSIFPSWPVCGAVLFSYLSLRVLCDPRAPGRLGNRSKEVISVTGWKLCAPSLPVSVSFHVCIWYAVSPHGLSVVLCFSRINLCVFSVTLVAREGLERGQMRAEVTLGVACVALPSVC